MYLQFVIIGLDNKFLVLNIVLVLVLDLVLFLFFLNSLSLSLGPTFASSLGPNPRPDLIPILFPIKLSSSYLYPMSI